MQERQLGSTESAPGDSYTTGDSGLRCSWEPPRGPLLLLTAQCLCQSLALEPVIQRSLYTQVRQTLREELCTRRLLPCLWSQGGREELLRCGLSRQSLHLSSSEAHLLTPSHAVSYSNSSDRHALGRRFSGA